ncbi:MAG: hypothetical protein LAO20_14375 [Acidobacteriia bacterium]|nr:hypothetical protein [Terriglobia bacterium]
MRRGTIFPHSRVHVPFPRRLGLGFVVAGSAGSDFSTQPFGPPQPISDGSPMTPAFQGGPVLVAAPTPFQNPDTLPGAWPGLNPATQPGVFTTLPAQVPSTQASTKPLVVTPTSGTIPSPATVAAAAAPASSWFDQQMIPGVKNSYLVLGGIAALLLFGGKKK